MPSIDVLEIFLLRKVTRKKTKGIFLGVRPLRGEGVRAGPLRKYSLLKLILKKKEKKKGPLATKLEGGDKALMAFLWLS